MDVNHAARALEKLGNRTRLEVFRLLVRAGPPGLSVGEIQNYLDVPASTLSHHLSHLINVGWVIQEREGRILRCRPNFGLMEDLIGFLTDECCVLAAAPGSEEDERRPKAQETSRKAG